MRGEGELEMVRMRRGWELVPEAESHVTFPLDGFLRTARERLSSSSVLS